MPLGFQKMIYREDLIRNRSWRYVFGDNVKRVGMGGQAKEMRGEPNAIGVATKLSPYFYYGESPAEIASQNRIIDIDMKPAFEHVRNGGILVWPADGIGAGLSEMPRYAPTSFAYLETKLAALIRVAALFEHEQRTAFAEQHL